VPDNGKTAARCDANGLPTPEAMFAGITPEIFQTEEDIEWLEMPSVGKEIID
jgi:hypothetical protein